MAVFSGNGSSGSPSFTFSSDTNSGMYRVGEDIIGFSTGSAISAGHNTTLYLTDRRVLVGTSSSTSDHRFIVQARVGNIGTGAGEMMIASGSSSTVNGAAIGRLHFGPSTHVSEAIFDARGNASGASLRWYNQDGSTLNHNMSLTNDRYLRLESGTGGIQFRGDSAAANALNDYEEGTYTPVVTTDALGATTDITASGTYTKTGNVVVVFVAIAFGASATITPGQTYRFNLPFATPSGQGGSMAISQTNTVGLVSAGRITGTMRAQRPSADPGNARTYQGSFSYLVV